MRALRQTIIISLTICIISLLTTLLITANSICFLVNWYNCLLCIFGGIFASSIVVLLSSLTNLRVRKREIASSYNVPVMQIDNEIRYLRMYSQGHLVFPSIASFSEDDFRKVVECYSLLAEKFITLIHIERMSWISQKQFNHLQGIINKQSLAFLEPSFKKTCADAAACCTIIAHEFRILPLYAESRITAEAKSVITAHSDCFNELIRAEGQYSLYRTAFMELLDKITKIPKSDEL